MSPAAFGVSGNVSQPGGPLLIGDATDVVLEIQAVRQAAPQVDKQAVRQLPAEELVPLGVELQSSDVFYWESAEVKVAEVAEA